MKANKFVRKCGPYHVTTFSGGEGVVYACVYPAYPEYNLSERDTKDASPGWKADPCWANHRAKGDGGGPGIFASMRFGEELSKFLNEWYDTGAVTTWQHTIKSILDCKDKEIVMMSCSPCGYVTSAPRKWIFCPECGQQFVKDKGESNG